MSNLKSAPAFFEQQLELTERERAVLEKQQKQWSARPTPRVKIENGASWALEYIDINVGAALLMETLGTADHDFMVGLLDQLCALTNSEGKIRERDFRFVLSVIQGINPEDQLVTMLAAQMAAVHITTMHFGRQYADTSDRWLNRHVDMITKLAKTFAVQVEALKRYRTGGEQKVTVQHVSVSDGGQAIVGNVTQAGTTAAEKAAKPTLALTDASGTEMPPVGGRERAAVSVRRKQNHDRKSSA